MLDKGWSSIRNLLDECSGETRSLRLTDLSLAVRGFDRD
jgi:hypothetical protein